MILIITLNYSIIEEKKQEINPFSIKYISHLEGKNLRMFKNFNFIEITKMLYLSVFKYFKLMCKLLSYLTKINNPSQFRKNICKI